MELLPRTAGRLATILFVVSSAITSAGAQTAAELRAKYGEPQMRRLKDNRPEIERYLVRPNITATVRYNERGEPRELLIEPVPGSTPKAGRVEHAPDGDYMSTPEVIEVINEVVPVGRRGKLIMAGTWNAGDPKMRLHHSGCTGIYSAIYERVTIGSVSWCWGGTFSATIRWEKHELSK